MKRFSAKLQLASQTPLPRENEEYAYGHVLEALSGGLYPNKLDILREYLQNSYDAVRELVNNGADLAKCRIDVLVGGRSITIHDNAGGMDLDTVKEYRKIGFSKKQFGSYAGWRGIGKAAGIAVAEKLVVTTAQAGTLQGHQLVFRAAEMLDQIRTKRHEGENIPFNELIQKFSSLESFVKKKDDHYTSVELNNIRQEFPELLDIELLRTHLSQIAPVPFGKGFSHGKKIQEQLRDHIDDYLPMGVFLENEQIFKPYLDSWKHEDEKFSIKEPEFVPVYNKEHELVAFAWYCMNEGKGQIKGPVPVGKKEVAVSGLVFRVYDIRIGDASLCRKTLWRATPGRALYALGEIHVLDPRVEPTSDRNDFVDNLARYELYQASSVVAKEISRKAGKQSEELRAEERIRVASGVINQLAHEFKSGKISRELIPFNMYKAIDAKEELERRFGSTTKASTRRLANSAMERATDLVEELRIALELPGPRASSSMPPPLDITEELGFSDEAKEVYGVVLNALGEYFLDYPGFFEELVKKIHFELRQRFPEKAR